VSLEGAIDVMQSIFGDQMTESTRGTIYCQPILAVVATSPGFDAQQADRGSTK
jgi:hypothetical protein